MTTATIIGTSSADTLYGDPTGVVTDDSIFGFAGDISGNFVAYDAKDGRILWNARIGTVSNAPQTYVIDGRQHVLVAAGDALFAFALRE